MRRGLQWPAWGWGLGFWVEGLFVPCEEVNDIIGQHVRKRLLLFQELDRMML